MTIRFAPGDYENYVPEAEHIVVSDAPSDYTQPHTGGSWFIYFNCNKLKIIFKVWVRESIMW